MDILSKWWQGLPSGASSGPSPGSLAYDYGTGQYGIVHSTDQGMVYLRPPDGPVPPAGVDYLLWRQDGRLVGPPPPAVDLSDGG